LFDNGQALTHHEFARGVEAHAYNEGLCGGTAAALGLDHENVFEDLLHHLMQIGQVFHLEELGDEGAALIKHF
jgi:hypothetical protein